MLNRTSFLGMLVVFVTILMQEYGCHSYQIKRTSLPVSTSSFQERQIMRRSQLKEEDDSSSFPKMDSDIFAISSDESSEHSRQEDNDASAYQDETSVLDLPLGRVSQPMKRRKGPTLSVVNPLEILRQRLMLDLAQRRIHQNQQQIVANAQLLENIGKRSTKVNLRQRTDMRGNNYQP